MLLTLLAEELAKARCLFLVTYESPRLWVVCPSCDAPTLKHPPCNLAGVLLNAAQQLRNDSGIRFGSERYIPSPFSEDLPAAISESCRAYLLQRAAPSYHVLVMAIPLVASAAEARTQSPADWAPRRLIEIVDARGVRFLGEERKNLSFGDRIAIRQIGHCRQGVNRPFVLRGVQPLPDFPVSN